MPRLSKNTIDSRRASAKAPDNKKTQRQATLYDAVAGRISSTGFIPQKPRVSAYRDTASSSTVAVPPEEVLFRRKGAPVRYEEDDFYWSDRNLNENQKLPESDLLKAIHSYASDFYGRAVKGKGKADFESLDETALLAVGILMEEMAGEVLGETGDMAFVEGEDDEIEGTEESLSEESNFDGEEGSGSTAAEEEVIGSTAAEESRSEESTFSGEDSLRSLAAASEVASEATTSQKSSSDGDIRIRKRRKTRHDDGSNG